MAFRAGEAVEPLEYDFSPYGGSGLTPEPTQEVLDRFQRALAATTDTFGIDRQTALRIASDPENAAAVLAGLGDETVARLTDPEARGEIARTVVDALVDFCQGQPSREEIEALPPRVREAFQGYLMGLFFGGGGNPTVPNGGIRRSPAALNGAAHAG